MSHPSSAAAAPAARALAGMITAPASPAAPANDDLADPGGDALLRAALRQFAGHGLGAAHHAQAEAEARFFAGDRDGYRWWLAVTRTLDRKLANELALRVEAPPAPAGALDLPLGQPSSR